MADQYEDRFSEKFKVSSVRNKDWDYSSPGKYHITICAVHHNNFFGKIINGEMVLSKMGVIARNELLKTFEIRKNIRLDEYVVMPSHVHILMEIIKTAHLCCKNMELDCRDSGLDCRNVWLDCRDAMRGVSTKIQRSKQTIPLMVQQYKAAVTRLINPKTVFFAWQDRYYDEIIKDEKHYWAVKNYIKNNVKSWSKDEYNLNKRNQQTKGETNENQNGEEFSPKRAG